MSGGALPRTGLGVATFGTITAVTDHGTTAALAAAAVTLAVVAAGTAGRLG